MTARYGFLTILLCLILVTTVHAEDPSSEAVGAAPAKPGFGSLRHVIQTKGIVTGMGERRFSMRVSGGGALMVVATPQTRISGMRKTFEKIAVSDIVRVEGAPTTSAHIMMADHVQVLLTAEATERRRTRSTGSWLWDWFKNGGPTLDLP